MQGKLEHWLAIDRIGGRDARQKAWIVYIILSVNALGALLLMPASPPSQLGDSVTALVITLLLLGLARAGYVHWVRWLLPLAFFGLSTLVAMNSTGLFSEAIFLYPALVALAGLLLDRRGIVAFTLLSIAAVVGMGYAHQSGLLSQTASFTPNRPALLIILIGMVGAFNYLVINSLLRNFVEMGKNEQAALESNRELQAIRASLEDQIAERTRNVEAARQEAEAAQRAMEAQMWIAAGQSQLGDMLRGEQDIPAMAGSVIRYLCTYLNAQVGALFVMQDGTLMLVGSYAYTLRKTMANQFKPGQGLVGQAALEKQTITLTHVPRDYMPIASGLVEMTPQNIIASPFMRDGQVIGVIEMAALSEFSPAQVEFLNKAMESTAIAFSTAQTRSRVNELLAQTQKQAAELQAREEALRSVNEELQAQAETLRDSQTRLRAQQAQLQAANAELEEKATVLQAQRSTLDRQNQELKTAQVELEKRAEELALANKYKSEFLANMSHELRTPLNSLLILARVLANNEGGNLTADQVESAHIIYNSGSDLLNLINEILDLSKVEAGRMEFHFAPMEMERLAQSMQMQFAHVAEEKGLAFEITLAKDAPPSIETDQQRVQQIVKNLLGNAFKFTAQGSVRLDIQPATAAELAGHDLEPERTVAVCVRDSGIGMTPDQQKLVFEAFQQADGSTSRKYGGTGLGLTISRELAARLGGYIGLQSEPGKGSVFTLYLPFAPATQPPASPVMAQPPRPAPISPAPPITSTAPANIEDDRDTLRKGDKVLLVIEDDPAFARVVHNHAHKKDFKCLVASDGEAGLKLAGTCRPDAIILDLKLPGMSGWDVLEALKQNPDTRHIPVHIMSALSEDLDAYKMGAMGFLTKPATPESLDGAFARIQEFVAREIKTLLVVEDDAGLRHGVRQLLGGSDVKISEAAQGGDALDLLRLQHFDCMILDLTLPDMTGFELLNRMNADVTMHKCPVIVYTGKALTEEENLELLKYANSVIVKGVKSPERLLDEASLFLHRVVADMPEEKQRTIKQLHDREAALAGKHVLVVDDDMRGAFALSRLLGEKGLRVSIARSGAKALEMLGATPEIDLVLMDIMMPEMDGYETIKRIRAQPHFRTLPILALTAKAMRGDQDKCIAAGANDYVSKPIDADRLFSMLRVWLYR